MAAHAIQPVQTTFMLQINQLNIHPVAQRTLNMSWVNKVKKSKKYSFAALGSLSIVRYPDKSGKLKTWVIDGQHRIKLATLMGDGDKFIACELDPSVQSDQQACSLFRKLNTRFSVSPLDNFIVAVREGEEQALAINAIVKRAGLVISKASSSRSISCIKALIRSYEMDKGRSIQGKALTEALEVCKLAWGNANTSNIYAAMIVEGLSLLFTKAVYINSITTAAEISKQELAHKLSLTTPDDIITLTIRRQGKGHDTNSKSRARSAAFVIAEAYNHHKSKTRITIL